MADFVLIHSTGQSAAGWERLADALEARASRAHAIDLPNDQPHLRARDYAAIVAKALQNLRRPIVVAHSGSGPLLPSIADALHASRQIWLAAWVPDPDASFREDVQANLVEAFNPGWIGKDPVADADAAIEYLYHDCGSDTITWALSTRRDFYPSAAYDERITLNRRRPSSYILATEDRTILPPWQRRMAHERLEVEPIEIAAGHCPNVSQPNELAEILINLAHVET
jgi:pimeloyl-ACP methyl ester carboxylesterase